MKIAVSRDALLSASRRASAAAASKGVHAIYESVRFEAKTGHVVVSATDLATALRLKIKDEAVVGEEGTLIVNAHALAALVAKLPPGDVTIERLPDSLDAQVRSGRGKHKLGGFDPADFPELPTSDDFPRRAMPAKALADALRCVMYAQATEAMRYALCGVFIGAFADRVECVACDGKRLAVARIDVGGAETFDPIVGKEGAKLLVTLLDEAGDADVKIGANPHTTFVELPGVRLAMRRVEGTFPNYREFMPKDPKHKVRIDRTTLLGALDRSELVQTVEGRPVARVDLESASLRLRVVGRDQAQDEALPCEWTGKAQTIGFDANFLGEALRTIADESVAIGVGGPADPLCIVTERAEHVLMPCDPPNVPD